MTENNARSAPEFRKIVLIGLGGSGQLILVHLKRLFMDTYGAVPPSIKFLCLDTDDNRLKLRSQVSDKEFTLEAQEFLYMIVTQPEQFIEADKVVSSWFVKPIPSGSLSAGAGAVRQNGRLAFFFHFNEFQHRIDNVLTQITRSKLDEEMAAAGFSLSRRRPEVYVCGSLAGGTGSGTFLDVGILLRNRLPNALIHGFFLLNWIYRNKAFAYRVAGNVYGALAELDNFQNVQYGASDFKPYEMSYGANKIKADKTPYNLFHLVDGRNELGDNIDDVDQLCETVATAIFLSVGCLGENVASVVDNLLNHVTVQSARLWGGKHARYSSFGVSSILYPAREMHRLVSLEVALKLCRKAIAELKSGPGEKDRQAQLAKNADENVRTFVTNLILGAREVVRKEVCPSPAHIPFSPASNAELADSQFPAMLSARKQAAQKSQEKILDGIYKSKGANFIKDKLGAFERRLAEMERDPAYRREWINSASQYFTPFLNDASSELEKAAAAEGNLEKNASGILNNAAKTRYIPVLGGTRKTLINDWVVTVDQILQTSQRRQCLAYEKKFYEDLQALLSAGAPASVPRLSDVTNALLEAERSLRRQYTTEVGNFKVLCESKPTQIIAGGGHAVIVRKETEALCSRDSFDLDYPQFKSDNNLQKPEDYLAKYEKTPTDKPEEKARNLAGLFLTYCMEKYKDLADVGVIEAMDIIGIARGNREAYISERIDQLFALSSAMWSFCPGQLNMIQKPHYDKIINLGVEDKERDKASLEKFVSAVKANYAINADHTYSTTGDKYRIWLLSYAAALPLHFLADLDQSKQQYEEEITPTYHIDRDLEMNVPDLFPAGDLDNKALRVLGMAIVPGIDVIKDEKLTKGHRFTLDSPEIRAMSFNEPRVWLLFRDMYAEVQGQVKGQPNNVLEILIKLLTEKVKSMSQDELKTAIRAYTKAVHERLEKHDFNRLISARLTYREIKELDDFLDVRRYGMNIDKYIRGY